MYILSIFFPLISFLVVNFGGRRLGFLGASLISSFCMFLSFLIASFIFYEVIFLNNFVLIEFFDWFVSSKFIITWSFSFDVLASIMLFMISLISFLVHIYSFSYMNHDPNKNRFISLLSLFTFFMLMLVTANSFLQLLLGWEGVGISSYLLINFWSDRIAANRAALKALFFNRVGDFGMILALLFILDTFKTLNFNLVFNMPHLFLEEKLIISFFSIYKIDLICFFIVLAAIAKSAQFFLHGWLTDAMEGPTPVSALIHAATMVTAGIFLIARFSPILQYSPSILNCIILFGVITTIIFSFSGQNTNDLKKIVASSTASQLAYMFFIAGLLDIEASIFHLFLHAFFKALLFLSAGSIIHGLGDQQDIRKMGGLFKIMPFNTFAFTIGSLSLIGLPAATGSFYSKDPIIEDTMLLDDYFDDFLNLGSELGVINTLYYNLKLIRIVFFGHYKGVQNIHFHDSSLLIFFCLFSLTLCSFCAPLLWEIFVAEDNMFSQNYTEIIHFFKEGDLNYYREEEVSSYLFWLIIFIIIIGTLHSEELFSLNSDSNSLFFYSYYEEIISADNVRWGIEYFLVKKIISYFFNLSDFFFFSIDRGLLEFMAPLLLINRIKEFSYFFISLQSGFIYHYVSFYLLSASILLLSIYYFFLPALFFELFFFLIIYIIFSVVKRNTYKFIFDQSFYSFFSFLNLFVILDYLINIFFFIFSFFFYYFLFINSHIKLWFNFFVSIYNRFRDIMPFMTLANYFFFFYIIYNLPYHLVI